MDYIKDIFVKDYFEIHNYYVNIYGKGRTLVLMQVGSFHECYATDDDGVDLISLSEQLDIICTKKNKNFDLSKSNPRMMGFPISVTRNYIDKLIDLNYTVILIDQVTEPPNPVRKVVGIYSPATHIDKKNNKTCYLVSIVIDKIKSTNQLVIGISAYDLSTGHGAVYETYSKINDILIGLDDTLRFLEHYPPKEIVLDNNLEETDVFVNMSVSEILNYLYIDINKTYKIEIKNQKKISYQRKIFEDIYNIKTNIDIFEYMGLEFLNFARISLILLLEYVLAHQPLLLEYLRIPELFTNTKYLYLGNRALEQLNHESLASIINHTKTALGKRVLTCNLTMPIIDSVILNERYNLIGDILENNHQNKIINYLEDIYDMDKLIRKVEINIINPHELYQLYISLYQLLKLNNYCKKHNLFENKINNIDKLKELVELIENKFNLEVLVDNNTNKSFYNNNIYKEIDIIVSKIDSARNFMTYLIKELEKFITDKRSTELITLKSNDRDGHYLLITSRRCELLKKNLNVKTLKIGEIELDINELEFNELPKSSNTKISCKKMKEISELLVEYELNLVNKLKEKFKEDIKYIFENYNNDLHEWSSTIGFIDFINSGAICARLHHYSKPIIELKDASYFKATELRHPIVEKINNGYVPHNLELGCDTEQNGILLYGINSSGKSTLMKSIGLNIILAQMGYYVAATSFTFSPYKSLFTRISGNDNIFKGLSSFMVEMMELMAILKRNDKNTLVIADELAKGTELMSAIVIVCYMLENLSQSNSSFITATHLHQIAQMESIKQIKNIKSKYLKITFDNINDVLIYERNLLDGVGENFYGLQVAKYLMKDKIFNERTSAILNEYNSYEIKQSHYNKNFYLVECYICKSKENLETHHIIFQKDFDENDININKFYLQKNDKNNLVCLCRVCHDKVDRNEIIINGYKETSNGLILDYVLNNVNNNNTRKYSDEIMNYIKTCNIKDNKLIRIKLKELFNKRISTDSIQKLISK